MALTSEQRRRKREKKEATQLRREAMEAVARRRPAGRAPGPEYGRFLGCWLLVQPGAESRVTVLVARALPTGGARVAGFLVDADCLGVKDAWWGDHSVRGLERRLEEFRVRFHLQPLRPPETRRLLVEAVEFGRGLGFEPHRDFGFAASLLQDVDPSPEPAVVEFANRGKPIFWSRPEDSPARCRQVLETLLRTCGPGGFHYVLLDHHARGLEDLLSRLES